MCKTCHHIATYRHPSEIPQYPLRDKSEVLSALLCFSFDAKLTVLILPGNQQEWGVGGPSKANTMHTFARHIFDGSVR